ncbi:general odorant-binding protein 67-like [Armigeres subalbatus]|uniref:general odorant-binding protein 67-like n=1 Tax=Armigeres subalbatus TaxID=124917 RepID=UPI002ED34CD8
MHYLYFTLLLSSLMISTYCSGYHPSCFESSTSKRADDCCLLPKFYDSQIVSDCLPSIGNNTDHQEMYKCLVECIAKKLNVFNGNKLNREASLRLYQSRIGSNPKFVPIMDEIFDQCYNGVLAQMAYAKPQLGKCNAAPAMLLDCVQSKLFLNCPSNVWQGGAECDELKHKLYKKCPFAAIASF